MAENQFTSTIESLFKGLDQFVTTKTVVGEPVQVGETIIVPLIDVTCGMAAGAFAEGGKQKREKRAEAARRRGYERKNEPQRCSDNPGRGDKAGECEKSGCHHEGHGYGARPDQ